MQITATEIAAELAVEEPVEGSPVHRQWMQWIDDAYLLLEDAARARGVDFASLDSRRADRAARLLVAAAVRNPDGASSVTDSVTSDDTTASSTRQFSRMNQPGLVLTDDILAGLFGKPAAAAAFGSIRLGVPSWRTPRRGA